MAKSLNLRALQDFVDRFYRRAPPPKTISPADFPDSDSPEGDLAYVVAIYTLMGNIAELVQLLSKQRPVPKFKPIRDYWVKVLEREILTVPTYACPLYATQAGETAFEDPCLARAIMAFVLKNYVAHIRAEKTFEFDYEDIGDWRTLPEYRPREEPTSIGEPRRLHDVKEFWRRHPHDPDRKVFVKAHQRGSRAITDALLATLGDHA